MNHSDFHIGLEFFSSGRQWRCTDVGSRVVVAIRIDEVTISNFNALTGERVDRTIFGPQAQHGGLFDGPPYMFKEIVFDENDLDGCDLFEETRPEVPEF